MKELKSTLTGGTMNVMVNVQPSLIKQAGMELMILQTPDAVFKATLPRAAFPFLNDGETVLLSMTVVKSEAEELNDKPVILHPSEMN